MAIIGGEGERIQNIVGLPDFNDDTREDFAIGSPRGFVNSMGEPDGAVYVVFRRARPLEGDYILEKLAYSVSNPERLNGVLITGDKDAGEGFGESLVGGRDFDADPNNTVQPGPFDFNGDGRSDLVIGNPKANGAAGEVWIVFADETLISPSGGIAIEDLHTQGRAARLGGIEPGSLFGFNVANIGDINGDGFDDLAVAAPGATPKFDPDPTDSTDVLLTPGLDRDMDGVKDDVTGPNGIPDGKVDSLDSLTKAGLLYVVYGGTDTTELWTTKDKTLELTIDKLGKAELPGFIIAGRRSGDQLCGGFAGELVSGDAFFGLTDGGIPEKTQDGDAGRSHGLAAVGDVDRDGYDDFLIGSILADPRVDPLTGDRVTNGGEAYLIYGFQR